MFKETSLRDRRGHHWCGMTDGLDAKAEWFEVKADEKCEDKETNKVTVIEPEDDESEYKLIRLANDAACAKVVY
jgi:hypothetical protein